MEFLNTGAWADNLGYDADKIYKRFPCTFYEDTATYVQPDPANPVTPPIFNDDIMCDLYTFVEGPHASLTNKDARGPYLIVYGFSNEIFLDSNYRL